MDQQQGIQSKRRLNSEAGASIVSYAIIAVIMVPVFVIAGGLLATASKSRGDAAIESSAYLVPCGPGAVLSTSECM